MPNCSLSDSGIFRARMTNAAERASSLQSCGGILHRKGMSQNSSIQIAAQNFVKALGTRDWDLLRSILSNAVVWELPGNSAVSGKTVGVDAAIARIDKIASYGVTFNLKHILTGPHGFALSLNNTGKREGAVLDQHLATVCEMQEGKIHRIHSYLWDIPMLERFFV
jgi:ketosteroid isomerase-like protein